MLDDPEAVAIRLRTNRRAVFVAVGAGGGLFFTLFWLSTFLLAEDFYVAGFAFGAEAGYVAGALLSALLACVIYFTLRSRVRVFVERGVVEDVPRADDAESVAFRAAMRRGGVEPTPPAVVVADERDPEFDATAKEMIRPRVGVIIVPWAAAIAALVLTYFAEDAIVTVLDAQSIAIVYQVLLLFMPLVAAVVVGLFVHGRLTRPSETDSVAQASGSALNLAEDLANAKTVEVNQARSLLALVGLDTRRRYEVLDGVGAQLCTAEERTPFLLRWLLGEWSPFSTEVRSFGTVAMRLTSRFGPFRSVRVKSHTGSELGLVRRELTLWRPRYQVRASEGEYHLVRSWLFRRRFTVTKGNEPVGSIARRKLPLLLRLLGLSRFYPDRFQVDLPSASGETRQVLLASVFVLDAEHFNAPPLLPGPAWILGVGALVAFLAFN